MTLLHQSPNAFNWIFATDIARPLDIADLPKGERSG
jgi:hypothetical protein